TGSRAGFGLAVVAVNVVAEAVLIAALVWGWGIVVATTFCWAVLPLLHLLLTRVDLWSTAAATVAIAAWTRDRDAPCGVALASGLAFKLWPALFVPLLLDRRRSRALLAFGIAGGCVLL